MNFKGIVSKIVLSSVLLLWIFSSLGGTGAETQIIKGKNWELDVSEPGAPYVEPLRKFLEQADKTYGQFYKGVGLTRARERILKIKVFGRFDEFKTFQKEISKSQSNSAFYSLFNATLYTWAKDDTGWILSNVYHEATHHYLRDFIPRESIPRCLDEGMAEVFEVGQWDNGHFKIGNTSEEWKALLKSNEFKIGKKGFTYYLDLPARDFILSSDLEGHNIHLAQCWAISHFLIFDEGEKWHPLLKSLLEKSGGQERAEKIIKDALPGGLSYEQFLTKWETFLKQI